MRVQNLLDVIDVLEVIDAVLDWNLSDEVFPEAFNAQIAGAYPD